MIQTKHPSTGVPRITKPLNNPSVISDQVTNGGEMRMRRLYPVPGDGRNDTD